MKESPIFIKSYELIVWVMQHTVKFPRSQRFLMARRMEEACLELYQQLNRAAKVKTQRRAALGEADVAVANLKFHNRLCKDLKLLSFGQYEYLAGGLDEIAHITGQSRVRAVWGSGAFSSETVPSTGENREISPGRAGPSGPPGGGAGWHSAP